LAFGDTLDSLLYAGLVAHARGDWQTAVAFFTFSERNERGYVVIRPLWDKVEAARSAIQAKIAPKELETAVVTAQQLTLDELLSHYFERT
jgi:hypothetical protein